MIQFYSALMIVGIACVTVMVGPVFSAGTEETVVQTAPYDEAKAMVEEGSFAAALPKLVGLTQNDPGNADAWNLLGFTYRKLGALEDSDAAYLKVLAINPDHIGALEYQGELFITQGKIDAAKANLLRLQELCGDCEEAQDLAKALDAAA
jgi:Flp pilus assembly protein TadD